MYYDAQCTIAYSSAQLHWALNVRVYQVALATLLSSYSVSLKPGHGVPVDVMTLGFAPDAVHIVLTKL
jgi:hypothetical protein